MKNRAGVRPYHMQLSEFQEEEDPRHLILSWAGRNRSSPQVHPGAGNSGDQITSR